MRIIIGTDGSEWSRKAVEEGCRMLAAADDLEIKIVSTYEGLIPLDAFAMAAPNADTVNRAAQRNAEDIAAQTEAYINRALPRAKTEKSVSMDFPERFIIDDARRWKADLIIVGSHGRGFVGRWTLGSVSDAILHHASCPVLVARAKA